MMCMFIAAIGQLREASLQASGAEQPPPVVLLGHNSDSADLPKVRTHCIK